MMFLEDVCIRWLNDLFNKVPVEGKCQKCVVLPILKGKGNIKEYGNYRGIRLMSHSMTIWEKIIDKRIRSETSVIKN